MLGVTPRNALESVASPRFLLSWWPWRSVGYLLSSLPVLAVLAMPLAWLTLPWLVAGGLLITRPTSAIVGILVLVLLGAVLVGAGAPLVAIPLAVAERWRLGLVDTRPLWEDHRLPPGPGLWNWLRTRYSETATWREVGYVFLFVVWQGLYLTLCGVGLVLVFLVASPAILMTGDGPVAMGPWTITQPEQAWWLPLVGLLLAPVLLYLVGIAVGAHAAAARALLGGNRARTELVEVARSRARLVDAFEAERRRIERDLHDGAQERLVSLTLRLGLAKLDLPEDSPARQNVADAHDQAKQVMAELRELVRGLNPRVLADRGLGAALAELGDRSAIPAQVRTDLPEWLPPHVESTAYFVAAEALTNVAKHSGATAVTVSAWTGAGLLVIEVGDNGRGGADPANGSGLTGLADRAATLDGRMLLSSPVGGPTLLRVELPCGDNRSE
ncbi:sensor histidine kinase [Kutzneria viridogrisea]